jgi:hypothetical protein
LLDNLASYFSWFATRTRHQQLSSEKHLLISKLENWRLFSFALREENRLLFNEMLNKCKKKEYFDCMNSKGKSLAAESLFLTLIFEQQKMINEIIAALRQK